MSGNIENNPGGPQQQDPLERARARFERQATSRRFNASAIQRSIDSIGSIGARMGKTPGELYAELADLSSRAVDLAGLHGQEADQKAFAAQQESYQQAGEQLSPGGIILPNSPSNPSRTTGRASG